MRLRVNIIYFLGGTSPGASPTGSATGILICYLESSSCNGLSSWGVTQSLLVKCTPPAHLFSTISVHSMFVCDCICFCSCGALVPHIANVFVCLQLDGRIEEAVQDGCGCLSSITPVYNWMAGLKKHWRTDAAVCPPAHLSTAEW